MYIPFDTVKIDHLLRSWKVEKTKLALFNNQFKYNKLLRNTSKIGANLVFML
jgi:hypothetical protein